MFGGLRLALRQRWVRLRHPDIFDEATQKRRFEALGSVFGGRSVAIVGNAQSIFDREHGVDVDGCDVVVRINRGLVSRPECQGRRTEVLALATRLKGRDVRLHFGAPAIVCVTPRRWMLSGDVLAGRDVYFLPEGHWLALSGLLGGSRPSAGISTTYAARHLGAASVKLFGFDWKATRTFYADRMSRGRHDWAAEQRLMQAWAVEGWLQIVQ